MGEAPKQFRRVTGCLRLPALRAALDATVTPTTEDAAAGLKRGLELNGAFKR
jgi:hypothetical protein